MRHQASPLLKDAGRHFTKQKKMVVDFHFCFYILLIFSTSCFMRKKEPNKCF